MEPVPTRSLSPTSPASPAARRRRRPLSSRLDDEWQVLRRRPAVLAHTIAWHVTDTPIEDLDDLLRMCGWRTTPSPAANELLRRLVEHARTDELAARVVLQRILPGLLAIVRRRRRDADPEGCFEELVGAAWLVINAYRADRRRDRVASNLVRDASYRAFTAPSRRRSATEVCVDPHMLDETPAVVVLSSGEELATLMAEGRLAGVDRGDLDLFRELLQGESPSEIASTRKVTVRTVRNHRDRTARRLREIALAA